MPNNVSVIIVNWNGEQYIERCLLALMGQTVKPREIILLDNGSSDESLRIAREFPSVRLWAQGQNTGFARGNNLAISIAAAESTWVALINPDAFAEPLWLETLLIAAKSNPRFKFFASKQLNAAVPTLIDGAGDVYHASGLVWRKDHGSPAEALRDSNCEVFSPCAASALYSRRALLDIGGFDEDYFCYVEDVDLGFRLRLAGYRCLYVPSSIVHHVGSGTTGGRHSDFSIYHGHRNLVWTFVKNMPGYLFWFLLPLHLLLNLVSVLWFSLTGHGRVIFRAKRDALFGLPKMWRKRKNIQKHRSVAIREIWRVLNKQIIR